MRVAKGPRPWTIQLFALAFLSGAVIAFLDGFWDIPAQQAFFETRVPELNWSEDAIIVMLSARLSIACIPVVLVWVFSSRIARWLVTFMGLGKLINVPEAFRLAQDGAQIDPLWTASLTLSVMAVLLLFLPPSSRWFARREEVDPEVFA